MSYCRTKPGCKLFGVYGITLTKLVEARRPGEIKSITPYSGKSVRLHSHTRRKCIHVFQSLIQRRTRSRLLPQKAIYVGSQP